MHIISISGKKSSGKSTVASIAQDILVKFDKDRPVHVINWADALKDEVCEACEITREYLEEHKNNFRLILQGWGTDFRRELHGKCYWTDKLMIRLAREIEPDSVVIIPDTRFINELDLIKQCGAYTWLITRPSSSQIVDSHVSENELDQIKDWTAVINNNSSIAELRGTISIKLEQLKLVKYV